MSGFGHYARTADELEREIVKRGIAIGLDFGDAVRLRELAQQALSCTSGCVMKLLRSPIRQEKLTGELFALSELMLVNMRQAAVQNNETVMKDILKQLVQGYCPQPNCLAQAHAGS